VELVNGFDLDAQWCDVVVQVVQVGDAPSAAGVRATCLSVPSST
jgi:hypothetical protein